MTPEIHQSTPTTEGTTRDGAIKWEIEFEILDDEEYLDSSQTNTEEELSIPREVIADVVGRSRLVAELERPIKIGTYKGLPAYLLRTHFAFQRASTNWLYRVQQAEITIEFEDAPYESGKKAQHPAVAAFHPELFKGEITPALVTESASASINAGYISAGAEVGVEKSRTFVSLEKGRVVVHGVRGGGRNHNIISWVVEQDSVAKAGIPRAIRLPLIVTRPIGGRFSARVTITAHYGFWRGKLARSIPVVGKNNDQLYFDPATLAAMAETGEKGVDGTAVAEQVGALDDVDLVSWSSLPN
ncbi:uncharacterized protein BDR25DRAFT_51859 [Lindgomyces ingoldianus]|uniref:Uncharacterized protein n=1 Tax=Lindgomyces ingoldianus TaxID=673940 RepID=A0ACB6QQD9_9PLEO|nr:uncharacterized protein BDR25DRAFT_51859 [Lindgomyces ingoldianus]KAF2469214.1 hypothetical protein BDR25DRAFT_51859 [Lindgomyces ingoldianus]